MICRAAALSTQKTVAADCMRSLVEFVFVQSVCSVNHVWIRWFAGQSNVCMCRRRGSDVDPSKPLQAFEIHVLAGAVALGVRHV